MRGTSSDSKRKTTNRISRMSQPHSPRHTQSSNQAQVPYACITTVSSTFNSLSKVLCTFPSRYLFAIGLELVLSLRWNVPPNLRSRPREHDSESTDRTQAYADVRRDSHPLSCPLSRDVHLRACWNRVLTPQCRTRRPVSRCELFPVRSPLLGESCSVSTPPLTYMLKFSG